MHRIGKFIPRGPKPTHGYAPDYNYCPQHHAVDMDNVPLLPLLVTICAAVKTTQVVTDNSAVVRERNAVAAVSTQQRVGLDDKQLTNT